MINERNLPNSISEQIEDLKQKNLELERLRKRLDELPNNAEIPHIEELKEANSASIGAMVIRAATEKVLRRLCEHNQINLHPNKKYSLINYLHMLKGQEFHIEPQIEVYLEDIRNTGNNAAHNFNILWDDFIVVLGRFCDVIEWYSEIVSKPQQKVVEIDQ